MGAMVTTCPHCQTTFKVSSEQLNAHEGDVRCGQCATVFNAYDSLASSEIKPVAQPPVPEAAPEPEPSYDAVAPGNEAIPQTDFPDYQFESLEQITYSGLPEPGSETEIADEEALFTPSFTATDEATIPAKEAQPITIAPVINASTADDAEPAPAKKRTWPWMVGAFVLLLTLLCQPVLFRYQLAYFAGDDFHTDGFGIHGSLSQALTELGAELVVLCNRAHCPGRHDLLNYSDNMSIESSELQADPTRPTVVVLNAVLHSQAKFPQNFPVLELTLTDADDKATARRTFKPAEYLPNKSDIANIEHGMPPGSEVTIKLYLDTQTIKAIGYRLYVYYP